MCLCVCACVCMCVVGMELDNMFPSCGIFGLLVGMEVGMSVSFMYLMTQTKRKLTREITNLQGDHISSVVAYLSGQ